MMLGFFTLVDLYIAVCIQNRLTSVAAVQNRSGQLGVQFRICINIGNQLLLQNLADKQDRSGAFVCAIACVFPEELNNAHVFLGKTEGEILHAYRGNTGFGYDPLFYYPPMEKSYAEMTADEKNSISHRGRAMQLLVDFLVKNNNGV